MTFRLLNLDEPDDRHGGGMAGGPVGAGEAGRGGVSGGVSGGMAGGAGGSGSSLSGRSADHPLGALPREDLDLILQLVLASGSLKDLASVYGVSYPTIRTRLDRTIARLREVLAGRGPDPVAELVADLVERGELSPAGGRAIRDLVRTLGRAGGEL